MGTDGSSITSKEAQNNFRRQAIRDLYYTELKFGYFPTINDLIPKVNNVLGQQIQPFALIEVYKSLGFEYLLNSDTNTWELSETAESRLKRIKYLKNIKKARCTGCPIVYVLISETIVGGVSIIVLVAAIESKVLKETVCVESAETFTPGIAKSWIKNKVINNIAANSIIALNESSFERFVSDMPNYSSKPKFMKTWLEQQDIPFCKDYIKPELHEVIKLYKEHIFYQEFCLKTIVIPDDNPGFNPLDIVWYNMEPYDYKTISYIRLKESAKAVTIVGMLRKLKLSKLSIVNLNKAIAALFGCMLEKIWHSCMKKVIEYEEKIIKTEQSADEFENMELIEAPEAINMEIGSMDMETGSKNMETEIITINIEEEPKSTNKEKEEKETTSINKDKETKPNIMKEETVRDALRNFTCDDEDDSIPW